MWSGLKSYFRKQVERAADSACRTVLDEKMKCSPALRANLAQLRSHYIQLANSGGQLPPLSETGFRVYSEYEEDGMLLFLFAVIGTANRTFVDIGAADGINSNCANLAINSRWNGLFIDGNEANCRRGIDFYSKHPDCWAYPPKFANAIVTRDNVNDVIRNAGFAGEVDLLSIDIDGHDYWILDALNCISPRVMVIECHVEFGCENIVVPYDKNYQPSADNPYYRGASPMAMTKLAQQRGYRLIGANQLGFNLIYLRNDVAVERFPEVSVESVLWHPRNREQIRHLEPLRGRPFVAGGSPFPGTPVKM